MSLKIVMGNMFSGKTSELIRRLKRYKVINKNVLVVNSLKDTRSMEEVLKTHDNVKFDCIKVENVAKIITSQYFCGADVIAIDEAQFFENLKNFVDICLYEGKEVLLVGLDGDYKQRKFGELLDCIPMADEVTKLTALCMECMDGTAGPFTKRTATSDILELIGDQDSYKAVCRKHL
jgi:thymidine kinase